MSRVRVKICGITTPEDALVAVEAGADAVGLVFTDSPRQVTVRQATRIVDVLPPWVTAVGVFADADPKEVAETARTAHLGAIQFHGAELPCMVEDLAKGHKVIKVFRVAGDGDVAEALDYLGQCRPHACLIDSRTEGVLGGSGQVAPWSLAAGVREDMWPLILSGGLRPDNVIEAIRIVRPFGVESSSGVEREPGRKDPELVRAFVQAAAGCDVTYPPSGET